MAATLSSIQRGRLRHEAAAGAAQRGEAAQHGEKAWTTGFYKSPITGPVQISRDGVAGDQIADTQHHGGVDKAVLAYAAGHYDLWRAELAGLGLAGPLAAEFGPGALAENLTILGLSEADVCIGDTWQVGAEVRLQVSQPRQPCWKINRRWQVKTLTQRVAQSGRTGWYCRVLTAGQVSAGDPLELLARPHPSWTIARANDLLMGRQLDRDAVIELLAVQELASAWKQALL